ncbi:MAG: hypothetical protein KDI15_13165, partial [Thiothrix sp.]|nr:hypothetical protein [Thiothrix sp.]
MFKRFCAPALLLVFTFGGCGSGTTDLSEGGIGGTGISIGPITGFGSILQNGVHYDVSQADFVRNGLPGSTQADFRIGEVVTINGQLNTNGTRGTAQTVTFRSLLQGVVTTASPDGRSIGVLGQTVLTDGLTVLHGFTLLNQIVAGNLLEVSGARDADGVIRASSIRLLQARFIPGDSRQWLEGVVRAADTDGQTFELGTLTVDYRQATLTGLTQAPAVGDYVRVSSRQNLQDLRLSADQVEAESVTPAFATGTELELKGLITQFADSTRFRVNGQPVITTATTEYEYGSSADLALNTGVAVEGVINAAGVLVATEVALRQDSTVLPEELEGSISSLNSARQEITVL